MSYKSAGGSPDAKLFLQQNGIDVFKDLRLREEAAGKWSFERLPEDRGRRIRPGVGAPRC